MTPYELNLAIEAYGEKKQAEMQEQLTYFWLGEYWHRTKKLPSLKEVIRSLMKEQNKKAMTDEEMLNTVKMLNAQFGGNVESGD